MDKKILINYIAERTCLPKEDAKNMLTIVLEGILVGIKNDYIDWFKFENNPKCNMELDNDNIYTVDVEKLYDLIKS